MLPVTQRVLWAGRVGPVLVASSAAPLRRGGVADFVALDDRRVDGGVGRRPARASGPARTEGDAEGRRTIPRRNAGSGGRRCPWRSRVDAASCPATRPLDAETGAPFLGLGGSPLKVARPRRRVATGPPSAIISSTIWTCQRRRSRASRSPADGVASFSHTWQRRVVVDVVRRAQLIDDREVPLFVSSHQRRTSAWFSSVDDIVSSRASPSLDFRHFGPAGDAR